MDMGLNTIYIIKLFMKESFMEGSTMVGEYIWKNMRDSLGMENDKDMEYTHILLLIFKALPMKVIGKMIHFMG